jgi:nucleotide-binding universal stress UspA family protein
VKTVLAPIDFSSVTDAVIVEAAALARSLSGRVVLLTAIQPPVMTSEYAPFVENLPEITAAGEKSAAMKLGKIEERLAAEAIPVETVQVNGLPVAHIVDQAQKRGADYIVMGSHGHTALYDLLVGSTTHGVLLRAKCPVVIVPAPKATKTARPKKELHAVA